MNTIAKKHQTKSHTPAPKKAPLRGSFWYILIIALAVFLIIMSIPKTWEEAVVQKENGSYGLSEKWEKTILRKQEKIRKHRLYMLVANTDGYFHCAHSPSGKFYLKAGEVYRYGTTGDTFAARGYSQKWLADNNLILITIMEADLATVIAAQTALIGSYALLPENLQRPLPSEASAKPYWYRLVLPPGNKSLD